MHQDLLLTLCLYFIVFLSPTFTGPTVSGNDKLINLLSSVPDASVHRYQLRDNQGRSMDCLKVFQDRSGRIMGLYHTRRDGVFSVHLAATTDLRAWTHVAVLDAHASQATIWCCDNGGFLLAYEKDAPNSCWMRLRYYQNSQALCHGKQQHQFDISRTLAPTAEGTPSFETVTMKNGDPLQSEIKLRFHYFQNIHVDQLARGVLKNFRHWRATPSPGLNAAFKKLGGHGNLGDRDKFMWRGKAYYLQEVQGRRHDWRTWRVYLCDARGMPIKQLPVRTHKGSVSFCNPNATVLTDKSGKKKLAVTLFLPSEGNAPAESGELIYVLDLPGKGRPTFQQN